MRVLLAIASSGIDAERLGRVAQGLHERGHDVTMIGPPGSAAGTPFSVQEGRWDGWPSALSLGRLLSARDIELVVAEDPETLGVLRWARRFHSSTAAAAIATADAGIAERELEGVRARARRYRRAVFLDRDGTLMPEVGALGRPEAVRLMPGVAAALRTLSAARYELVVVSNQSAIGRGVVTEEAVRSVNAALRRTLRAEGVELSAFFLCPHRPEDACDCRKPAPGLLLQAATALDLTLADSWLIGDSTRDIGAAAAAGVRGILLQSGWGGADPAAPEGSAPGLRARHIGEAARLITAGGDGS